jgi:hypothetical protein
MSDERTLQEISDAMRAGPPIIIAAEPRKDAPPVVPPVPHDVWDLPGGTAWVYLGDGNSTLTRPVILADGFNSGPSTPEFGWGVVEYKNYGFLSALRKKGLDVVMLGFQERSASILTNAEAAIAAVKQAVEKCQGRSKLAVGGFSMGGLVTRYALAKMEHKGDPDAEKVALYWSYDSPHRGAWIPISLQALGHYIRSLNDTFSNYVNSPAGQQLLRWHIATWNGKPEMSKEREDFLKALRDVGDWPKKPWKIGVANGLGNGQGNGNEPGALALEGTGASLKAANPPPQLKLNVQSGQSAGGNPLVAELFVRPVTPFQPRKEDVYTSGIPAIGSAPGGTLDSFGIVADAFNKMTDETPIVAMRSVAHIRSHCFVPSVSAVAIRDVDTEEALYTNIDALDPKESELDEFRLASGENEEHTLMTDELCSWIIERIEQHATPVEGGR